MLFNSTDFLIFFTLICFAYFLVPFKFRNYLLLAGSYYFYMCWKVEYILLIVFSTLIDYFCALGMGKYHGRPGRKWFLIGSLLGNLGLLFIFKYFNFFSQNLGFILNNMNIGYQSPALKLLLPVGISFYTFQTLSYSLDVYRGDREPEKNFLVFAVYVSYFPQLVAGPIERSTHLMPQFHREVKFSFSRLLTGLVLIMWGFFMKLVIADNAAEYVNTVYGSVGKYQGQHFVLGTFLFCYQIFCDFAGYSSIAIGTAKIMGIDMMQNFRRPYFASSIQGFWRRWHISLSTWFRDYLYIPLGGSRRGRLMTMLNTLAVFLVSGLWHGANWTFVTWGALHGVAITIENLFKRIVGMLKLEFHTLKQISWLVTGLKIAITFLLVNLSWIFFRSASMHDAIEIFNKIYRLPQTFKFNLATLSGMILPFTRDYRSLSAFMVIIGFIVVLETVHIIQEREHPVVFRIWRRSAWPKIVSVALLACIILFFGKFDSNAFIYFQF